VHIKTSSTAPAHNAVLWANRAKAFLFATKTGYSASEALAFLKRHSRKASYNG